VTSPAFRHSQDLPRLKALAFEAIRIAGPEGADATEIASSALQADSVPGPVAAMLVESLLDGDRRIEKTAEGRYVLKNLASSEEGTSLTEAGFCVVDVETTGVTSSSRIIEVGAVRVRGLVRAEEFQSLVNVDAAIPAEISDLTGITQDMLSSAPGPEEVLGSFCDFLADDVFCAHNAPFDRRFIFRETEHFCLRTISNPVLCTRLTARRAMPGEKSYSLDSLVAKLSIDMEMRHRGLADARAAADVLIASIGRLMEQGVRTVEQLLRIQRKPQYLKFLKGQDREK
jgi:DNA polymerase III epsilon subunit family exonuclease